MMYLLTVLLTKILFFLIFLLCVIHNYYFISSVYRHKYTRNYLDVTEWLSITVTLTYISIYSMTYLKG